MFNFFYLWNQIFFIIWWWLCIIIIFFFYFWNHLGCEIGWLFLYWYFFWFYAFKRLGLYLFNGWWCLYYVFIGIICIENLIKNWFTKGYEYFILSIINKFDRFFDYIFTILINRLMMIIKHTFRFFFNFPSNFILTPFFSFNLHIHMMIFNIIFIFFHRTLI